MLKKILIFVPTYNEKDNVITMVEALYNLHLSEADMLFVDDNSPDGTGQILEEIKEKYPKLIIKHREDKLGIGSAHLFGINWAYENKYDFLITLDCDFTHPPEYIPKMLERCKKYNIVVTSRFLNKDGIKDWNLFRKTLSLLGHVMTMYLLRLKYDATGAFRVYSLKSIDKRVFGLIRSKSYSFFFESLFILNYNKYSIAEIPIKLPARTYGHSKMHYSDALKSLKILFNIFITKLFNARSYRL